MEAQGVRFVGSQVCHAAAIAAGDMVCRVVDDGFDCEPFRVQAVELDPDFGVVVLHGDEVGAIVVSADAECEVERRAA